MAKQKKYKTVRGLLKEPTRWCKKEEALDAAGDYIAPSSPRACSWCMYGALTAVYGWNTPRRRAAKEKLAETARQLFPRFTGSKRGMLDEINDSRAMTHEKLMKWLNAAKV